MKNVGSLLFHLTIVLFFGLNSSCSLAAEKKLKNESYILTGCTPGDDLVKSQLGINAGTKIDFIRWTLQLNKSNSFVLNITFGESEPNTPGFKAGGQSMDVEGTYSISKNMGNAVYHLEATRLAIAMVKLNDNLFHLLTPENRLMVGNGGWSYTLNNKNPVKTNNALPTLTTSDHTLNSRPVQVIYDGRTPCREFAAKHKMNVSESCFKLKWKLVLNRDSVTNGPTTYTIRKVVDNIPKDITGNWTIIKGTTSNPDAVIYQLDPDKPNQSISLLAADENILYFLHPDKSLFVGNGDFSFTLNKRMDLAK